MLVVISIIALLIAILLPALGAARESAVRTECMGKLQQVATSSTAYAADNKGLFIAALNAHVSGGTLTGLHSESREAFEDYGFAAAQWTCPGWDYESQVAVDGQLKTTYFYMAGRETWANTLWGGDIESRSPITLEDASSEVAMATDVIAQSLLNSWLPREDPTQAKYAYWSQTPAHGRNDDQSPLGSNHIFADGSGSWITANKFMQLHTFGSRRRAYWYQPDIGQVEIQGYLTPPE